MEQIFRLNDKLSSDPSWRNDINQTIEILLVRMDALLTENPEKVVRFNTAFMNQLSIIKEKIQTELSYRKYFPPIDIIQINYSYFDTEQINENLQISTDNPSFQNIIIIGDSIRDNKQIPIKIMEMTNRVTNINNILFVYPDYHAIVSYRHLIGTRYDPITTTKIRTVNSHIQAYQLNLLEPISWHGENPWDTDKFVFMQFGFKTDIRGIHDRIVGSAIKIMWINNLQLENLFTPYFLCKLYEFLPGYIELLYRLVHGKRLNDRRECQGGGFCMLDYNTIQFYKSTREPMRLINEMSNVLLQYMLKERITYHYLAIFGDSMNKIGRTFNPNHIIETICCMEYLGGAFRDLVQPIFEVMLVL